MPQIIVSPDELRRFANELDRLRASLAQKRATTTQAFEGLGQSWRDAKYQRFEKLYSSTCAELDQFLRTTEAYANFLRNKANKADRYLRRS